MQEAAATEAYEAFRRSGGKQAAALRTIGLPDGSWLFVEADQPPTGPFNGVAVRPDGQTLEFHGALGKQLRLEQTQLGAPRTSERFLGSTAFGRYQAFNGGVAVWEGVEDFSYTIGESLGSLHRQVCAVAFFDLRGFTSWAVTASGEQRLQAIEAFEAAVHEGFPAWVEPFSQRMFLKGTGDGAMIVSQADWFPSSQLGSEMTTLMRGHATLFRNACERTVLAAKQRLAHVGFPLAVGCGIAAGPLDRVFLFGRLDFIGPAANEASKLQQHSWNEVCVTRDFGQMLALDGYSLDDATPLGDRGWRLRALQ